MLLRPVQMPRQLDDPLGRPSELGQRVGHNVRSNIGIANTVVHVTSVPGTGAADQTGA